MDLDLDVMHDDVRVDEENLGFVEPFFREKARLGTKSRKSSAIGYNVSILNTE